MGKFNKESESARFMQIYNGTNNNVNKTRMTNRSFNVKRSYMSSHDFASKENEYNKNFLAKIYGKQSTNSKPGYFLLEGMNMGNSKTNVKPISNTFNNFFYKIHFTKVRLQFKIYFTKFS